MFFCFSKLIQIGTLFLICRLDLYNPMQKRDLNGVFLNSHGKVGSQIALTTGLFFIHAVSEKRRKEQFCRENDFVFE